MPRASDVLAVCERLNGVGENPDGSNHNQITEWYGFSGAWCDMSASYELYFAGFNDGEGKIAVPGREFTSAHGDAYCPYTVDHYIAAGMWDMNPRIGDAVLYDWEIDGWADHIGRLAAILNDGTLLVWEGNHNNVFELVHRNWANVMGFGHEPYDDTPPPPPPDEPEPSYPGWPGRYIQLTSPHERGDDVRTWQAQMQNRGWRIDVDGDYGPQSAEVCRKFQVNKNLTVDRVIGDQTWTCTFTCPVT